MIVYIFLIVITTLLLYFSRICDKKMVKNIFFIVAILMMTLVAGFRWNVGTDFFMYNGFFEIFKNHIEFTNTLEPMFMLFCYIPGRVFSTSFMTFTLIALFTYFLICDTCKKNCKYYDLSVLLFLCLGMYFSTLNIVRQWMAIAVLIKLYSILEERINFKHILLMLVSFLCHYTSIFIIPILIVCRKINKERTRIIILIAFVALKFMMNNVMQVIINLVSNVSFFAKYFKYFAKKNYISASILWPLIILVVYVFYYFFLKNKMELIETKEMKKINIWINILVFAFGFELLGTNVDIIERMSHYFYPIIILIIPKVYEHIQNKDNKKICFIFILLFSTMLLFANMKNNGGEFLPYETIFGGVFN